jgi:hypothetical protein
MPGTSQAATKSDTLVITHRKSNFILFLPQRSRKWRRAYLHHRAMVSQRQTWLPPHFSPGYRYGNLDAPGAPLPKTKHPVPAYGGDTGEDLNNVMPI